MQMKSSELSKKFDKYSFDSLDVHKSKLQFINMEICYVPDNDSHFKLLDIADVELNLLKKNKDNFVICLNENYEHKLEFPITINNITIIGFFGEGWNSYEKVLFSNNYNVHLQTGHSIKFNIQIGIAENTSSVNYLSCNHFKAINLNNWVRCKHGEYN